MTLADPDREVVVEYAEGDDLDTLVWADRPAHNQVIKCHAASSGFVPAVQAGSVDAVVFTFRDPMTALASCVEQFCNRPPFNADWTFERALDRVTDGLKFGSLLEGSFVVLFVDLHRDGEAATIAQMAAFLGVEASPEDLARIQAEFSFDAMRERSAAIAEQDPETLLRGINDPQTLMHANHVDKGVHRDWRSELTEEQVAAALERFAPYLQGV